MARNVRQLFCSTPLWLLAGVLGLALTTADVMSAYAQTLSRAPGDGALTTIDERSGPEVEAINQNKKGNRFDIRLKNVSLIDAVNEIAKSANIKIGYSANALSNRPKVSIEEKGVTAIRALEQVLSGTGMTVVEYGDRLAIVAVEDSTKAKVTGSISGRIIDAETKAGIAGVKVSVIGSTITVLTDRNGEFQLGNISVGEQTISARLIGFSNSTQVITVIAGKSVTVNFSLKSSASMLSEVVTTATGMHRKVEVGNDITVIKVDSVMRNSPVTTLTDLLATRVPGLYAAPASGEPGAPTRIRIRGVSSINASNDPIVIVDGVQVYARVVEPPRMDGDPITRAGAANQRTAFQQSPLDQINPSTIESVEVLKGPSAVALYGSDAANGVIVITTKRGRAGSLQWNLLADLKTQYMPGEWPLNYWAWGHQKVFENELFHCTIMYRDNSCIVDSLITYQILNDPNTTTFGRGLNQNYSGSLRGGTDLVTYSLTGNTSRELGLMKLPDADVALLERSGNDIPATTKRPQRNERQSGTGRIDVKFGKSMLVFTTTLARQLTQGSPLSGAINQSARFDPPQDRYDEQGDLLPRGSGLIEAIPDFRRSRSTRSLRSFSSINLSTSWSDKFRTEATAGIDLGNTYDESLLKNGECAVISGTCDGTGEFSNAHGTNIQSNINLRASVPLSLNRFTSVIVNSGANLVRTTQNKISALHEGLPIGATSGFGAERSSLGDINSDVATAGAYIGTTFGFFNRFYIPLEIRKDAGSALGSKVAPTFPRLSLSYIISDEPVFYSLPFAELISTLRFRVAYGQAGKQPRAGDAYRTYTAASNLIDGGGYTVIGIDQIGNPFLRPERTREIELGIDVEAFEGRLTVSPTVYRKNTRDLLVSESLPLSVGGLSTHKTNLGDVKNSGWDLTLGIVPLESSSLVWSSQFVVSASKNLVTRLNRKGGLIDGLNISSNEIATLNIVGYPLNSNWAKPIVGYADRNNDGKILSNEIILGDSAMYVGAPYPKFVANIHQSMTIGGQITLNAVIEYKSGLTQIRGTGIVADLLTDKFSRAANDPDVSLGEQAHRLYSSLARVQTVSSTQFTSLSLGWIIPQSISSRLMPRRNIQINLQGTNLGLWTNYRGKDPNVGASGEGLRDGGSLPSPRTYGFSIRIG